MPSPRATIVIAAVTAASYFLLTASGYAETADILGGFIPARLSGIPVPYALPVWLTPLSATLLHGGILHLAFNLLMLVFCGKMVEAALGMWGIVTLYVVGAYAAAVAQYLAGPTDLSPMIGASGAISAIFGGYALLFSQPRIKVGHPVLARAINLIWLAVAWIVLQFLMGYATTGSGMVIATAAHVGGFLAGLLLAKPLLLMRYRNA